ncbi:MAG: hypothetical protein J0M04_21315 [Verrucomicrobia bacterium]|nr:hypothetical protein [Verrucomicrobiota bacterium]
MNARIIAALAFAAFTTDGTFGAAITSMAATPYVGSEDISHLGNPASDTLNINGTGAANTAENDASTYVANDRTTQGQTFTVSGSGAINGIWVKHVGYTATLTNGTWSGLTDGSTVSVRIHSVSGTVLTQIASETATVASGSGIGGGGQNWAGSGMDGTGKWLHLTFDTPVVLPAGGIYAFDLTSTGPWFELAGLEAGTYEGGAAFTTQNKNDLSTASTFNGAGPAADHGTGDRIFIVDIASTLPAIPTVIVDPLDASGFVGGNFSLISEAQGDPAPTYQWERSEDGTTGWAPIPDATEATYPIIFAMYADQGYYRVVATNTNGSDTSGVAHLTLTYPNPAIVTQPASTAAQVGSNVTLSVSAGGLGNLSYQWHDGNDNPVGTGSNELSFTNIQSVNAGNYYVIITDDAGLADTGSTTTIRSETVTLSVFEPWSGLVSHESFDTAAGYVEGSLPAQNTAVAGYTGPWTGVDFGTGWPGVSSGTLAYTNPLYLGSSGAKASVANNSIGGEINAANSGRVYRMLDAPLVVGDHTTGTRYLSFLFQSGQETGATVYQMLSLASANTGDGVRPFDIGLTTNGGHPGTNYNFGVSDSYTSTGVAADAYVHLFVVRFDLSAAAYADTVTVWVDPAPGAAEPSGGTTVTGANLNWNRIFLSDYDGNSAAWDEIRWGSSFSSVTLNPNPPDDYAAWISGYPGVGALTGFDDDADRDGIKNGLENLFGTDPSVSNQGIVQIARSGNTVTFQHPANATPASDVSASYVWSTDLTAFHADGENSDGATVNFATSTAAGITSVTATVTGTLPARLFLSLKATRAAH